ncbi:aminodeoxychorismate/anthranilate synthase component II [Aurantimonas sp. E1-2-R+4]|uniref:anthranilate synthase component II n=1 Tax=Aurantimonas sp. E1-2-R+4 TaxID=3113714 RepID=UPI002F91FE1A
MILVIDNYDSFVFNVARYLDRLGGHTQVVRNDSLTLADIEALRPTSIIVSPGPCTPAEAGISRDLVRAFSGRLPILGVCLGHQVIGEVFGGTVIRAMKPMHGRASELHHGATGLFETMPSPTTVGRYHSLIVEETPAMLESLRVDARSPEGEIMALSHRAHPTYGIQFHPESVLSEQGELIFKNFLTLAEAWHDRHLA